MGSSSPGRRRWRRLRSRIFRLLLPLLTLVFGALPWRVVQGLGSAVGAVGWRLSGKNRQRALKHLEIAFPGLEPREREAVGRRSFLHHGANLGECLHLLRRRCPTIGRRVEVQGWERLEAAREERRPLLILTAHCGNWELVGAAVNCRGLEMAAMARRHEDPWLHDVIVALRARFGTETIARGAPGARRLLLRKLRGDGALAMLIDQDTRVSGVWVPFFGRLAYTPVAAAQLARKHDALVLPAFDERREDGSHLVRILEPLDLREDEVEATAEMTRVIEAQIRRRPEQWVWMHKRWRRRPPEERGEG